MLLQQAPQTRPPTARPLLRPAHSGHHQTQRSWHAAHTHTQFCKVRAGRPSAAQSEGHATLQGRTRTQDTGWRSQYIVRYQLQTPQAQGQMPSAQAVQPTCCTGPSTRLRSGRCGTTSFCCAGCWCWGQCWGTAVGGYAWPTQFASRPAGTCGAHKGASQQTNHEVHHMLLQQLGPARVSATAWHPRHAGTCTTWDTQGCAAAMSECRPCSHGGRQAVDLT